MDTMKKSREKRNTWEPGDCLSVPPIFFGPGYSATVPGDITKIYGRVKEVFTHRLLVKWDLDQNESHVYSDKVTKEPKETKSQYINVDVIDRVITADDYEEAGTSSSKDNVASWKMEDEDMTDDADDDADDNSERNIQFFINEQRDKRNKRKREKIGVDKIKRKKRKLENEKEVSPVASDVSLIFEFYFSV